MYLTMSGAPMTIELKLLTTGTTVDIFIPTTKQIIVGTKPASGPVMPISNNARRWPIRASMAMTAPMVPIGEAGMGIK